MIDSEDPIEVKMVSFVDLIITWLLVQVNIVKLSAHFNGSFKTNLLGGATQYCGCTLVQDWEEASLVHQESYVKKMVERFDTKMTRNTPACVSTDLRPKEVTEEVFPGSYRQLVERLM